MKRLNILVTVILSLVFVWGYGTLLGGKTINYVGDPQTRITAGGWHTCALTASGGVKCWGHNDSGRIGDGTEESRNTPVDVSGLSSGVVAVAAGRWHTCALTASGGVKCWGANRYAALGDGTEESRNTPVDVSGLSSNVVAVDAGGRHTCVLTDSGGMKCWGAKTRRKKPVDVSGLSSGVVAIAAGMDHTCALMKSGGVKCWGSNDYGQIGDGTIKDRKRPVDVSGLSSGVVLMKSGGVKCWGSNVWGSIGDGTEEDHNTPVDVSGLSSGMVAIAAVGAHTCVLMKSGGVKCWGKNDSGQLGDGTQKDRKRPVDVSGLSSGVVAIAAGMDHTCALMKSGGVKCWGSNDSGQLGDGGKCGGISLPTFQNIPCTHPTDVVWQ